MKKLSLFSIMVLAAVFAFAQSAVVFQVDMSNVTVGPNGVHIAGDLQAPAGFPANWDPAATALTDANADGIYEVTLTLADGSYGYKFVNGNAWGSDESVPAACVVGGNRGITVAGAATVPAVCFGSCAPCPAGVVFRVDMKNQTVGVNGVHIAGDFQAAAGASANWTPGETALTDPDMDNIYTVTVTIPDGTYAYKFVNGNAWGSDEGVPAACAVGGNRSITVSGATTSPLNCYASCDPCPAAIDTLGVTLKVNMANFTTLYGSPATVTVAGNFQAAAKGKGWSNWTPGITVLTDVDGDKVYESEEMMLPEGTYAYKFLAGSAWGFDELLVGGDREFKVDGIAAQKVTFGPYCFGDKVNDCSSLGIARNVTMSVDMNNEVYNADSIFVFGSFSFPVTTRTKLTESAPGSGWFSVTRGLFPGTYGYKFGMGMGGSETGDFTTGGCGLGDFGNNRKLAIPAGASDTTLVAFVYNACELSTVSIDKSVVKSFSVAPNPFTNRTVVSFKETGVYTVEMTSITGQVVSRIANVRSNSVEISGNGLTPGMYLLSITSENGARATEKVILQ